MSGQPDIHQIELARSLDGKLVRFAHERKGGPVHQVVAVSWDAMVELNDMGGFFAPHLFEVADDIGGIPQALSDIADETDISPGNYRPHGGSARLKCPGVGRDKDNISALQFYFSRRVTDEEMRFLHDVMQRAVANCRTNE